MNGRSPVSTGDLVVILFPFTDLSARSLRPALVVARLSGPDVIVAFVTTSLQTINPLTAHVLRPGDNEFETTGLKLPSAVRLDRLATLHRNLVQRRLGHIGANTERSVGNCLRYVFGL